MKRITTFFMLCAGLIPVGCGPRGVWQRLEHPSDYAQVDEDDKALDSLQRLRSESIAHPEDTTSVLMFLDGTEDACRQNGLFARRARIKEPIDPVPWATGAADVAMRAAQTVSPATQASLFTRAGRILIEVGMQERAGQPFSAAIAADPNFGTFRDWMTLADVPHRPKGDVLAKICAALGPTLKFATDTTDRQETAKIVFDVVDYVEFCGAIRGSKLDGERTTAGSQYNGFKIDFNDWVNEKIRTNYVLVLKAQEMANEHGKEESEERMHQWLVDNCADRCEVEFQNCQTTLDGCVRARRDCVRGCQHE